MKRANVQADGPRLGSRIRVVHVIETTDTSGYFMNLAAYHDATRYHLTFCSLYGREDRFHDEIRRYGADVLLLGCQRRLDYIRIIPRLASELRKRRIDVVHGHLFDPSFVALLAARIARVRVAVQTRHHADLHQRMRKPWHSCIDSWCARQCDQTIAVSEYTRQHLLSAEGIPPAKTITVYNGLYLDRLIRPSPDALTELRHALGVDNCYVLLTAGNLHPQKGQPTLFQALPAILKRTPKPVVLLVAGQGPFEFAYRQQVASLGIERAVRFLGFRRDIAALMALSDVFVLPSETEAFGYVFAEALAMRTPVIGTLVGGIPEIVEHGVTGILVPPANPGALADVVTSLLGDVKRREAMATAGHDSVLARFSPQLMLTRYEALYDNLLIHKGMAWHGAGIGHHSHV